MSYIGETPKYRFEEGKPFPNAEKLFVDFKQSKDFLEIYRKVLEHKLFQKRKSMIDIHEAKTSDEFHDKVVKILEEINTIFDQADGEDLKIEKINKLAKEWGVVLDSDYVAREAFAYYIYHDSEWSGIKLDSSSADFIVTDGR